MQFFFYFGLKRVIRHLLSLPDFSKMRGKERDHTPAGRLSTCPEY